MADNNVWLMAESIKYLSRRKREDPFAKLGVGLSRVGAIMVHRWAQFMAQLYIMIKRRVIKANPCDARRPTAFVANGERLNDS